MMQLLQEYLTNKTIRSNLPYRYLGYANTGFYFVNGEPKTKDEVESLYPIGKPILWSNISKGENPDKTHIR